MSTLVSTRKTSATDILVMSGCPWGELTVRIRESLARQNFFVSSSTDLSVLWDGESVDALERRRRIMVFAAQHHWKVEIRMDGNSARFLISPPSGLLARETLRRNHE